MKTQQSIGLGLWMMSHWVVAVSAAPTISAMANCSLCSAQDMPQDMTAKIAPGTMGALTCQEAFDLGHFELPQQNCTTLRTLGSSVCQCGEPVPDVVHDCTLCQDGGALPQPYLEARPERICALVQVDAKRDDPQRCSAWQSTYGNYCGCDNSVDESSICRICGDAEMDFDYLVVVDGANGVTCGDVELEANGAADPSETACQAYRNQYSSKCCKAKEEDKENTNADADTEDKSKALQSIWDPTKLTAITIMASAVVCVSFLV
uniref:Uncharacterized protein n=1 Tax=Craspedostauros australis TaxID=1486917 RepID=A0A7R9WVT3_9STRA